MKFGLFLNLLNKLGGKSPLKTPDNRPLAAGVATDRAAPTARKRKIIPPMPPERKQLDVNLIMSLRRGNPQMSERKIARKMGVTRGTIHARIVEYESAEQASAIRPQQTPYVPSDYSAKVEASRKVVAKKKTEQPPSTPAAPAAIQQSVPSSGPMTSPVTNIPELVALHTKRYGDGFSTNLTHVFLVRPEHLKFGIGSEQPCIAFDRWYSDYSQLEIFQTPTQFYVLVVAADGSQINRAWLDSIAADIWLRERCLVHRIERGGVLEVFQSRYGAQRLYPAQAYGARLADETFERWHKFEPMPLHNHHDLLAALAKDAVPIALPQAVYEPTGWTAPQPMPPIATYDDRMPRRSEGAGGLAIGGDGEDNWK